METWQQGHSQQPHQRTHLVLFRVLLGDEILPSYIGIIINQYRDHYETTSIMESRRVFFVAQLERYIQIFPNWGSPSELVLKMCFYWGCASKLFSDVYLVRCMLHRCRLQRYLLILWRIVRLTVSKHPALFNWKASFWVAFGHFCGVTPKSNRQEFTFKEVMDLFIASRVLSWRWFLSLEKRMGSIVITICKGKIFVGEFFQLLHGQSQIPSIFTISLQKVISAKNI